MKFALFLLNQTSCEAMNEKIGNDLFNKISFRVLNEFSVSVSEEMYRGKGKEYTY